MTGDPFSRRTFLKTASVATAASFLSVGCSHQTHNSSSQPAPGEQAACALALYRLCTSSSE